MKNFIELIDTYLLNYSTYKNGKVELECDQGELIFYKKTSNVLTIHGIYIYPEYRQQGLCREILQYLIDFKTCSNKFAPEYSAADHSFYFFSIDSKTLKC